MAQLAQGSFSLWPGDDKATGIRVVYARYERSEPFCFELFEGFSHLRVLTYSASVPMTVRMLNLFSTVECVFGYEGVLQDFGTILPTRR